MQWPHAGWSDVPSKHEKSRGASRSTAPRLQCRMSCRQLAGAGRTSAAGNDA